MKGVGAINSPSLDGPVPLPHYKELIRALREHHQKPGSIIDVLLLHDLQGHHRQAGLG